MNFLKAIYVSLFLFPISSFAALSGQYSVSGLVTKPSLKQCYFTFSIQTDAKFVTLGNINCGPVNVFGGPLNIEGEAGLPGQRLLKNQAGSVVGIISDSLLEYQENGMTLRVSMNSDDKGFMQFSTSSWILTGKLTRKP